MCAKNRTWATRLPPSLSPSLPPRQCWMSVCESAWTEITYQQPEWFIPNTEGHETFPVTHGTAAGAGADAATNGRSVSSRACAILLNQGPKTLRLELSMTSVFCPGSRVELPCSRYCNYFSYCKHPRRGSHTVCSRRLAVARGSTSRWPRPSAPCSGGSRASLASTARASGEHQDVCCSVLWALEHERDHCLPSNPAPAGSAAPCATDETCRHARCRGAGPDVCGVPDPVRCSRVGVGDLCPDG